MRKIPETLMNYDFNKLFNLKPDSRSKVLIYNKKLKTHEEKTIFRSYSSFLNTPKLDENVEKSYMFLNKEEVVPVEFSDFVNFVKDLDPRYNQMVINWYNPEDYIELHSDCSAKMINDEAPILTINLNESNEESMERQFKMVNKENGEESSFRLKNNHFFVIKNNKTHRHCVGTGLEKRISLTFRMMKE